MLRRGIRKSLPRREQWHSLQEYAVGEANQKEFGSLRMRDSAAAALVAKTSQAASKPIDWSSWESQISHKEVFTCLKDFHAQQTTLLDSVLKEDHMAAVKAQTAGWELFDAAVKSCEKSVEKSETIVKNGARALYISFNNPPISLVSQSEWLDTDQYWQAFVEKHQFYHEHILSAVEDPESKEYDAKNKADLQSRWEKFDGKGTTRQNNKLLYQRPSYEYYDLYRGPLVEHMIFYLTKTGGDARFFPQNMPVQWFAEIYDLRFKIYNVLQRRLRAEHEKTLARTAHHDFHPHDLEHEGDGHFAKLIAREVASTELLTGRLMGNFVLFSDAYIPVQTGTAFYRALQTDDGKGTFYTLGSDVHCLFYKPAGEALTTPDPTESFHALADHAAMTGRRFQVGYAAAMEAFCEVLETRKEGLGGCWLAAPGESTKDAFMRRLKKSDPAYAIYEAYAEEHGERWTSAKALSIGEALKEMPEIERKYLLECEEYDNVMFALSDEFATVAKADAEQVAKLQEAGKLQAQLDSGALVAIEGTAKVTSAEELSKAISEFEDSSAKAVDAIMATKLPALEKKK
eukprot:gnl/TRDRNA2_/TRDRNA2_182667_c0_seq1.p1 gnl/TRDRNA2_/TRDRNA2_182667_c0~~gnl/TRDRNA2_/TRDRNA2_182667_c0_seq1.p1  ORF type:complete len:572 (+),score=167.87 gnl/TRDRNA2_/TRDRNA2_182667_c0_seq1:82-1797(+)